MSSLEKMRAKLQKRIFGSFGSDATIIRLTHTIDKWGDTTTSTISSTLVKSVPYNQSVYNDFQPFADLKAEELTMVLPYDVEYELQDELLYDGKHYLITESVVYPYDNGVLAKTVRLSKKI